MIISLEEINAKDNDWILKTKDFMEVTSAEKLACDTVFHLLNNEFFKQVDGTNTSFEQDVNYSFWCDNHLYVQDGVMKIVIDDEYYVFSCIYLTESNHIVVEALEFNDIWEDDDVIEQQDEDNEYTVHYFKVGY